MNQEIYIQKQWFIKSREGKIEDYYILDDKELSAGQFGKVFKAKPKLLKNDPMRAVKVIPKRLIENKERFLQEVEILRNLDHPNIIKLYETFEDIRNIYLVMELCTGGELFDQIVTDGQLSEKDAQQVFIQIMRAISYCHSKGIAHRDLKPENFLYYDDKPGSLLKVIDFGLSRVFRQQGQQQKQLMKSRIGSPYYISPEVLDGQYDELCDIWSAGVILFILLTGIPPFNGENDGDIVKQIKAGQLNQDLSEFQNVSDQAKDLIQKMIYLILNRSYNMNGYKTSIKMILNCVSILIHQSNSHSKANQKKHDFIYLYFQIVLAQIASQVSLIEIEELSKLFQTLDKDGNGQLSFEEFKNGFKEKKNDLFQYFEAIDTDSSGSIDYNEFIAAMMERSFYLKQDKLLQAFHTFDLDNDGKITSLELKKVLGDNDHYNKTDPKFWDTLLKDGDFDEDGQIDYLEFVEMMSDL
ncbi:unnamed protein product [Paramecium sonneborni]|uniref:non-specific serine/threonine protein kinase n=1 Tax=Paramecium sonneborni TaxID=65129 RepID=A0A8S1R855_9CILI|nr:unnamed protein product [Paramecium sonneborni]